MAGQHQRAAAAKRACGRAGGALTLVLADGSTYPQTRHVPRRRSRDRSEDRHDPHQRAFPNPEQLLRPGQYGRVRAETARRAPTRCSCRSAPSPSCRARFRCASSARTTRSTTRTVTLGERVGSRWIVEDGLEAGDRVVVEGPAAAGRHGR